MSKKLTTLEFINKSKLVHGNKYDYSLVEYLGMYNKVKLICKIHKNTFEQLPVNHIHGKVGCPKCGNVEKLNNILFKEKANKIHNNEYDYSLVKYKNYKSEIVIICKLHGKFNQTVSNHLSGKGCAICANNVNINSDIFIERAIKIHNNKYDYSLIEYINAHKLIKIKCIKHDYIFKQSPTNHLSGKGCPKCNTSKGELTIQNFLNKYCISYISQYRFKNCKFKKPLPFDFYLPNFNMCIEYQGEQHYKPFWRCNLNNSEKNLINTRRNDLIKKEYCLKHNIKFQEILYTENIENRLKQIFNI